MKKIIISTGLMLAAGFAQAQATSQMEVSATVESGCLISGTDFNFGNISSTDENASTAAGTVTLRCSKGVNATLAQTGVNRTDAGWNSNVMRNESQSHVLNYKIRTTGLASDAAVQITQPRQTTLGSYVTISGTGYDYRLGLRFLNGEARVLNLTAEISAPSFTNVAGLYSDTVTYTLAY